MPFEERDLDEILDYVKITELHNKIIRSHNWASIYFNGVEMNGGVYCNKCYVELGAVLYKQQDSDGTKWAELTCEEILIKNLLE